MQIVTISMSTFHNLANAREFDIDDPTQRIEARKHAERCACHERGLGGCSCGGPNVQPRDETLDPRAVYYSLFS
jgi:hypothetical protein